MSRKRSMQNSGYGPDAKRSCGREMGWDNLHFDRDDEGKLAVNVPIPIDAIGAVIGSKGSHQRLVLERMRSELKVAIRQDDPLRDDERGITHVYLRGPDKLIDEAVEQVKSWVMEAKSGEKPESGKAEWEGWRGRGYGGKGYSTPEHAGRSYSNGAGAGYAHGGGYSQGYSQGGWGQPAGGYQNYQGGYGYQGKGVAPGKGFGKGKGGKGAGEPWRAPGLPKNVHEMPNLVYFDMIEDHAAITIGRKCHHLRKMEQLTGARMEFDQNTPAGLPRRLYIWSHLQECVDEALIQLHKIFRDMENVLPIPEPNGPGLQGKEPALDPQAPIVGDAFKGQDGEDLISRVFDVPTRKVGLLIGNGKQLGQLKRWYHIDLEIARERSETEWQEIAIRGKASSIHFCVEYIRKQLNIHIVERDGGQEAMKDEPERKERGRDRDRSRGRERRRASYDAREERDDRERYDRRERNRDRERDRDAEMDDRRAASQPRKPQAPADKSDSVAMKKYHAALASYYATLAEE